MPSDLEMTQAEYARHRGVSRQAISKLVAGGKITVRQERGKKLIDAAAADRALGEVRERIDVRDDDRPAARGFAEPSTGGLTKAKTATEVYKARIAQLDFEERVGRLVGVEQVTRSVASCGELIVRVIDRLPNEADDLAAALAREGVPGLRKALKDLAARMRNEIAGGLEEIATRPVVPATAPDQVQHA